MTMKMATRLAAKWRVMEYQLYGRTDLSGAMAIARTLTARSSKT